ncbi:MAG: hypothetical protein FWF68_08590 [Spirochaetes bacterium]|nr:hypothetical protein [Brevinematales bacterium]MCL1959642.1 hypothetical protein [Spirochaetota bacterium]
MKYFTNIVITTIFSFFSCGGMPNSNPVMSFPPQAEESQNETFISSVSDFESKPSEELSKEDIYTVDIFEEKAAGFDIADKSADIFPEQDEIALSKTDESELLFDSVEIASIDEPQLTPQAAEVPQQPPVSAPSAELSVQVQTPAQTQPTVQAQTQPPLQTQTQPPAQVQTQPPAQTVQPMPVQAPLSLAPAEERPLTERENTFTTAETSRFDTVKDEYVTPFQTVLIPQNETITFSRIVNATVGQSIEIPFRGTGWVYMGELASRRGIAYDSSRNDPDGQSLIFKVESTGTYALHFFKRDLFRDYVLNDYVQVIAGEAPVSGGAGWFNPPIDGGRVVAQPRWPTALEEAEIQRGGTGSRPAVETPPVNTSERGAVSSQGTVPAQGSAPARGTASTQGSVSQQTTQPSVASVLPQNAAPEAESGSAVIEAPLPPDVLLQKAKDAFDSGNIPAAIALLDQYSNHYQSGTDELYWLYGQFYEANSPSRNILLSLDYYRRLVREYPQSKRYNDARGRIAYLERYYINIQ